MSRNALRTAIVGALVLTSVAVPFTIHHEREVQLRSNAERSARQARTLSDLSAENTRLSNLVDEVSRRSLSDAEVSQLLKLRGEIGRLRDAAAEAERLRIANPQLATRADPTNSPVESLTPDPQTVQVYWSRDQLASAGYGDPVSALKTALWAMNLGDGDALAASVTPEARADLTREHWNNRGEPADEITRSARSISESLTPCKGFYVVGQKAASPDLTLLDVFFAGEGKTRKVAMSRIDGEWKLKTIGRAGQNNEEQLMDGSGAWP